MTEQDDEPVEALRERWRALLAPHHADPDEADEVFAELVGRIRAPERRYHDLATLRSVLCWIDRLEHRARDPDIVRLAAWMAVASGALAAGGEGTARWVSGALGRLHVGQAVLTEVERLLMVLADQDPTDEDDGGEVLCDAALAVVGADAAEYRAHVEALCQETMSSDPTAWPVRRRRIVGRLISRDSVFRTPEMRAAREGRAQLNLAREAASLQCLEAPTRSGGAR